MSNTFYGVLWVVESDFDIIYMIRGQCDLYKLKSFCGQTSCFSGF